MIPIILAAVGGGAILGWVIVYLSTNRGKRHKLPSLTKYVVFSIAILLIYTTVEFIFATITSTSHDTLTTCVYACFGGEILSCALIKIFKLKEESNGTDNV